MPNDACPAVGTSNDRENWFFNCAEQWLYIFPECDVNFLIFIWNIRQPTVIENIDAIFGPGQNRFLPLVFRCMRHHERECQRHTTRGQHGYVFMVSEWPQASVERGQCPSELNLEMETQSSSVEWPILFRRCTQVHYVLTSPVDTTRSVSAFSAAASHAREGCVLMSHSSSRRTQPTSACDIQIPVSV